MISIKKDEKNAVGQVALVGAGPGDGGLLTIKGAKLLSQADVVVYDRLVSSEILSLISPNARCINVGKTAGNHPVSQEEINQILLQIALDGKSVVRLKGGDPFVFGRGGEELELLVENDVPFTVVPGISSVTAALTYAGIPVTHRDSCSSFHVITGHARSGKALSVNYRELVALNGTLLFLMGVSALSNLMTGLLKAGMNPKMPAAVIENGTLPNQRKILSTVAEISEKAAKAEIRSPAIIAVGKVCTYSEKFDWFAQKPLFGKKLLVTRPKETAGTICERLRELGAEVLEYPCIEMERIAPNKRIETIFHELSSYKWVLFTSKNGVNAFFAQLFETNKDVRQLGSCKIGAVGKQTADALKKQGVIADAVPTVFDGAHLAELVSAQVNANETVLLCTPETTSGEMESVFEQHQISYEKCVLYRTKLRTDEDELITKQIKDGKVNGVVFTSKSTVLGFAASSEFSDYSKLRAYCIGMQTAAAAQKLGMHCEIASEASVDELICLILEKEGRSI